MSKGIARRIVRHVTRKPRPENGTQYRNRINQAASKYSTSERQVHAAMFEIERGRCEWHPEQVSPCRP